MRQGGKCGPLDRNVPLADTSFLIWKANIDDGREHTEACRIETKERPAVLTFCSEAAPEEVVYA